MNQKLCKLFAAAILCSLSFTLSAQYSQEFYTYKKEFPNAHLVRLNQQSNITLAIENNKINVTQEILEENLYLDESATYNSKESISFSSFVELNDVEASSYAFDNGKYQEDKVDNFTKKDELENSFYDDTKSLNFIYSNLKEGSKTKLKYIENIKNPRFLNTFYFGDFFPIIHNKFTIVADKDISLKFKVFNTDSLDIEYNKEEKRGKNIYTWEIKNIDEYKNESGAPFKKILPHIIPILTSYKVNGKTVNILNTEADLYNWYYSLIKDLNKESPSEELVKVVLDITADKKSDLDKVKAIYYWVQQNIKYIDYEYALGGFIPREANIVYKKKYGDCKDNSSILEEMLKIADLKGHLTWIGTRNIPYSYKEVSAPVVDNHMILTYFENNNPYFLDATGRFLPLGLPSSFIQGKEALIENGKEFIIQKVPVVDSDKNKLVDTTYISMDGDDLKGTANTYLSGYRKIDYFQELEQISSDNKQKEFYNEHFQKGTDKFLIEDITENNKYSYDKDFVVNYSFKIKDYAKAIGDEIYLNLNLNKELSHFKIEKDRKNIIEYNYKRAYNYNTIFQIPEGYKVEYLPENFSLSNKLASVSIAYLKKGNSIEYHHNIKLNFLTLDIQQQKQINDFIDKTEKSYQEIIILKKITTNE